MSDTREKLIEIIIKGGCDSADCDRCEISGIDIFKCLRKDAGLKADQIIKSGVTVQKWIPVSERLPEHGEVVLCYMSFKDARALQWDNVSQYWLGYGSGDDWSKAKVTHWMPLPEPPKGE